MLRRLVVSDYGQGKHIPDATLGLNDAGRARITLKLASEAKDLHIDAAVEYVFMNACRLQQVFAAQRPLRRIEKRDQKCVLAFCQGHRNSAGVRQAARAAIELPAAEPAATLARPPVGR
jgi:hypothetical protein